MFTEADKAKDGDIELKKGEFLGFTPDGRVIKERPKEYARIFDNESSYFIFKFKDKNGAFYKWTGKNYTNDKGDIFDVPDVKVTGKVAIWRESSAPACYSWYKFLNVKNYTADQFDQIKQRIAKDDGTEWIPDYVADADKDCYSLAKSESESLSSLRSRVYFTNHASLSRLTILSELSKVFSVHRTNTLTQKNITNERAIIISIEGDDVNEIEQLKSKSKEYLHLIFSIENGTIKLLSTETSDKLRDKLLHIHELIKNKPWASQAIILYEVADLLDKGIEYLKIPESVWGCDEKSAIYKEIIHYLFQSQIPILLSNNLSGYKLTPENEFAFACGLWDGTIDIIQSVPKLAKLLTCYFHEECANEVSTQLESFKNAVIEDENGNITCAQEEYLCKAGQMISAALGELVADNCKVAHTVGSIVGPIIVMCVGDVAAGETVIARLGKVGSSLKYAIKGLQLCDKVTDITRPLAKGLKVTTVLVKKAGKLLPEIRIEGKTILHYVGDKLHLRKFDAVTKKTIDEPIEESKLSQKVKEVLTFGVQTKITNEFINSLSSNARFLKILKDIRIKGNSIELDEFVNLFVKLHKSSPANSVKSLDNVMSDFLYLIDNHLSDFIKTRKGKQQITSFLNELMQSTDKFKAGATTLEVIHNAQKYIPSKYYNTLSDLQLEDLIAYADDAGDFRFDIQWSALSPKTKKAISIFVDTKNYSSASNMFKDLGQFKAYLRVIDNFDQLYIIQQGGRGVTREQIIAQLERAIAKDTKSVYTINQRLWNDLGVNNFRTLQNKCNANELLRSEDFLEFRNIVVVTK